MRSKNIAEIQQEVVDWANEAFPNRESSTVLLKMAEEFGELVRSPADPLKQADVMILLVDLADMYGVDLTQAIENRMHVNRIRRWSKNRFTGVNDRVDTQG